MKLEAADPMALQELLDRALAGDNQARNDLIDLASHHFRGKVHLALQRDNPRIARFEQTGDVLQEILIRLDNRLHSDLDKIPEVAPSSNDGWSDVWR